MCVTESVWRAVAVWQKSAELLQSCSVGRSRPRKELALKGPSEREPSLCTYSMCVCKCVSVVQLWFARINLAETVDTRNIIAQTFKMWRTMLKCWIPSSSPFGCLPAGRRQPITRLHLPLSRLTYIHFHTAHKSPLWLELADRRPSSSNLRILRVVLVK